MSESQNYDLIVIGGGPGGSSAAITAARTGARVLLLEGGRLPRHKVCGEFVSAESLAPLTSLLSHQHQPLLSAAPRIGHSRIFLDGRMVPAPVDPKAASIARYDLDSVLLKSCEDQGVTVRTQATVQSVARETLNMPGSSSPLRVTASSGDFLGRAVINASGRWSRLSGTMPPQTTPKWIGIKAHFSEPAPSDSVDLYFFDGGYCGVQPVKLAGQAGPNRVNASAMVKPGIASTLAEVLRLHPALRQRSRDWQPLSDAVSTSPLFFRSPVPARDGILFAGDAAAFVDPFVGDGISLALRSGALAAESLGGFFQGKASLEAAADHYADAYEKRFASIFNNSARLRRMLLFPRPIRKAALMILERAPVLTKFVVRKTR